MNIKNYFLNFLFIWNGVVYYKNLKEFIKNLKEIYSVIKLNFKDPIKKFRRNTFGYKKF